MCRNIRPLFNFDPPATDTEIQDATTQFVRKIAGMTKPSTANQPAFEAAVSDISQAVTVLLADLQTSASPRDRVVEAERARQRAVKRFG